MGAKSSNHDEIETLRVAAERLACDRLLERLRFHHDYNMPSPPEKWEPAVIVESEAPAPVLRPISEPYWFHMVEDAPIRMPRIADIKRAICRHFNLGLIEIYSERRTLNVVYPRQIAFYLAKTLTTKSLPEIGRQFGGKDHTTVLHGVRKIERLVRSDWRVAFDVAAVEGSI